MKKDRMMMHENQILVAIKRPGEEPFIEPLFDNDLKAFQKEVGGYIESFTISSDLTIICNEEGRLFGLPYNTTICGQDFVGTIMAVAYRRDEFVSIKGQHIPFVLRLLKGTGGDQK